MPRVAILGCSPYIYEYWRKSTHELFAEVGGNTGNIAFEYAIAKNITDPIIFVNWGVNRRELREKADIIVLPLSNQLGAHMDLGDLADELEAYGLPVIGLGLGAQAAEDERSITLTPGTERWLRTLAGLAPGKAPNIGLRGAFTLAQIDRLGLGDRCAIMGCPSNFINLVQPIEAELARRYTEIPVRIAVNGGIPYIPKLRNLEVALARLVDDQGAYIVQHDLEMVQLARNEFHLMAPDILQQCHDYIMPDVLKETFLRWCRAHAFAFFDARAWMDFLRRFDFVLGTRFHGAMLAIQAGVPAACIAHDSRTLELCQTMAIPVAPHGEIALPFDRKTLPDLFPFDAAAFAERRKTLGAIYLDIMRAADIAMAPELVNFASPAP
jgi:hypothetical protein